MLSRIAKFSTSTFLLICTALLFSSCGSTPIIKVDQEQWKGAVANCTDYRTKNYKQIVKDKDEYLEISEVELVKQLGSPDKEGLEKRMKKSIKYCVYGCNSCDSTSQITKYLSFELGSLRRVRAIYVIAD